MGPWLLLPLLLAFAAPAGSGWYERGLAAFREKNWPAAEEAFHQAVRENPRDARAWKLLGMVYSARENYAEAIGPFSRACSLNPEEENAC